MSGGMSNLNKRGTAMRYNNLGASGLMISELSFGATPVPTPRTPHGCGTPTLAAPGLLAWRRAGCMTVQSVDQCYEIMRTCYEGGINFFDNAEG